MDFQILTWLHSVPKDFRGKHCAKFAPQRPGDPAELLAERFRCPKGPELEPSRSNLNSIVTEVIKWLYSFIQRVTPISINKPSKFVRG